MPKRVIVEVELPDDDRRSPEMRAAILLGHASGRIMAGRASGEARDFDSVVRWRTEEDSDGG